MNVTRLEKRINSENGTAEDRDHFSDLSLFLVRKIFNYLTPREIAPLQYLSHSWMNNIKLLKKNNIISIKLNNYKWYNFNKLEMSSVTYPKNNFAILSIFNIKNTVSYCRESGKIVTLSKKAKNITYLEIKNIDSFYVSSRYMVSTKNYHSGFLNFESRIQLYRVDDFETDEFFCHIIDPEGLVDDLCTTRNKLFSVVRDIRGNNNDFYIKIFDLNTLQDILSIQPERKNSYSKICMDFQSSNTLYASLKKKSIIDKIDIRAPERPQKIDQFKLYKGIGKVQSYGHSLLISSQSHKKNKFKIIELDARNLDRGPVMEYNETEHKVMCYDWEPRSKLLAIFKTNKFFGLYKPDNNHKYSLMEKIDQTDRPKAYINQLYFSDNGLFASNSFNQIEQFRKGKKSYYWF
jgi:hypothetical protein